MPDDSTTSEACEAVTKISLQSAGSVRRHLPSLASKWLLPDYLVGPECSGLNFLFSADSIQRLTEFSPIVFYGDSGVGKTALAITLAANWSRQCNLRPVCFSTAQSFAADFAAAIEIDDTDSFRLRHRGCKMLVIDDLDSIVAKNAAQDELCFTLDELGEQGRPIILTSSRLPASLRGMKSSLGSRLSAGLSLPISRPGRETRRALIEQFLALTDTVAPVDVVVEIADQTTSNPLSASEINDLVKICVQSTRDSDSLDRSVVRLLAQQHFGGSVPTVATIAKGVAKRMRIKLVDLKGSTRAANIVRGRSLAMYLSRELTDTTLQQIGQFFGGRDHSTVLHSCRKTEKLLKTDSELANLIREIRSDLANHP